ncbi:MAG: HEAT repeat domain-containing protein [Pseudomonadota bacterium]
MGLLDFLSKEGRDRRSLEGNVKRAVNKYAQSPDRYKAMQGLLENGSPDAIFGAIRRFGMMYDKSIEDEQEKEWLFDALVEKGAVIIPQLERYLQAADSISWPLRLLDKVAAREHELEVVKKILERHEPGYERDPTKKIQLLNHLAGLKDAAAPALVVPYLVDMDEGVRYAAAEALIRLGAEEIAREPLIEHFISDTEESLRVRLQIADGFADKGWLVKSHRPAFDKKLPDQFTIDRDGRLKKKAAPAS